MYDIARNMKTTVDIPESLLRDAKRLAAQKHVTLRSLFEQGLRHVVSTQKSNPEFRLRKASYKGNGLQKEFLGQDWQEIRSAAYERHGG